MEDRYGNFEGRQGGRALGRLGEEARSLLYLKEAEGMGVAELASVFRILRGTVKSRLSRARAALEEEGYESF